MAKKSEEAEGPRLIKRYGNRRLYDTVEHRCISRDELAELARARIEFVVRDARTGEDLTPSTLVALLTEGTLALSTAMPLELLRELASMQQRTMEEFFSQHVPAALKQFMSQGQGGLFPESLRGDDQGSPDRAEDLGKQKDRKSPSTRRGKS